MSKSWFERGLSDRRQQRLFAEERAVLVATEEILEMMQREGITKSDLAKSLGKSKAYVSQALNGGRNMTLRTLAAFAWACGYSLSGLNLHKISGVPLSLATEVRRPRIKWAIVPSKGFPATSMDKVSQPLQLGLAA